MGRYRWRTTLRSILPAWCMTLLPKGSRDCGDHEWYRAGGRGDTAPGPAEAPSQPVPAPCRKGKVSAHLTLEASRKSIDLPECSRLVSRRLVRDGPPIQAPGEPAANPVN